MKESPLSLTLGERAIFSYAIQASIVIEKPLLIVLLGCGSTPKKAAQPNLRPLLHSPIG